VLPLQPARLVLPRAAFLERFNHERPHQALGMRVPGDLYAPSTRPYRGLTDLTYPFHDWTAVITPLRPPLFRPPQGQCQPSLGRAAGRAAKSRAASGS